MPPRITAGRFSTGLDIADLGTRVRAARIERGLSLGAVAERAGVSRSMLSAVERASEVPTVLVLDRIATALDTSIARLLGEERAARVVVLRHAAAGVARTAGWERRILSPVLPGVEFEFMRTTIAPGVDAGVFAPHRARLAGVRRGRARHPQLTLDGRRTSSARATAPTTRATAATRFANRGREPCVYYLAMALTGAVHARTAGRRRRAEETLARTTQLSPSDAPLAIPPRSSAASAHAPST